MSAATQLGGWFLEDPEPGDSSNWHSPDLFIDYVRVEQLSGDESATCPHPQGFSGQPEEDVLQCRIKAVGHAIIVTEAAVVHRKEVLLKRSVSHRNIVTSITSAVDNNVFLTANSIEGASNLACGGRVLMETQG